MHPFAGRARYSDRASQYARARPSYPAEAIDWILGQVVERPRVLDVGSGTGIATRLLAAGGARPVALEPNLPMIVASGAPVPTICAAGEALPLRADTFDLVTVFNAFHWLRAEEALAEIRRVLRAGGKLAVAWNDWDHTDAFTSEFVKLMRSYAGDFPPEDRDAEVAPLYASAQMSAVERRDFPNRHVLDAPGLRARIESMSYIPLDGPDALDMRARLDALFQRYAADGVVVHHYTTCVFVAR
jgi:SAM-dependent methyltransferase